MKKGFKSLIAMILTFCISLSMTGGTVISKQLDTKSSSKSQRFVGNGFEVDFCLQDDWDTGFNAEIKIKNTGETTIENWILWMNYQGELSYSWNSNMIVSEKPEYTFKNVVWNQDIVPGGCVSFGINANEGFVGFPESYQMLGGMCEYSKKDYEISYYNLNEWESGFTVKMSISNLSEKDIEDWILEFDYDRDITNIWNAQIVSHVGNHYVVKNMGYNSNISYGGTLYFGFNGTGGKVTDEQKNYKLSGYSLYDGDSLEIDTDIDGIPDGYEKMLGTDYRKSDSDGDGLDDCYEIEKTNTSPLNMDTDGNGINDNLEDSDEDGVNNEVEYSIETDPKIKDSDKDGLDDYQETNIYNTDPLNIDTDGDTLSDYDDVKLGLSPLLRDTDKNGITDDKERVYQTLDQPMVCDEKDEITKVSVSLTTNGNIENSISIDDIYGVDQMSSDVVGLVGVPVEITSSAVFDEAELSFYYDSDKLGNTIPEDLIILWYDKDINEYKVLENSTVDSLNKRVYAKTTHFSTYMVVDSKTWYGAWKENIDYTLDSDKKSFDVSFVMDVSGSMYGIRLNNAKTALKGFVDELNEGDIANLIAFSNNATIIREFTSDKESLKTVVDRLYAGGGTNVNSGLLAAIETFKKVDSGDNKKMILLLCDGDVNYYQTTMDKCKEMGISIYSVNVGNSFGKANLEKMAKETGGEYYYCRTSDEIEPVFAKITQQTIDGIDTTDTDGDGLFDVYETDGIRLINGRLIKTDPLDPDTDGDGLSDYEETGIIYEQMNIKGVFLLSDPTKADTDGDELNDYEDDRPWDWDSYFGAMIYNSKTGKRTAEGHEEDFEDLMSGDLSYNEVMTIHPDLKVEMSELYESMNKGVESLYKHFIGMVSSFCFLDLSDVAFDMIAHAKSGHGEDYSNSKLTEHVMGHSTTKTFVDNVKNELVCRLSKNKGNVKPLLHNVNNIVNNKCIFNWVQQTQNYPHFDEVYDNFNGLKICIHDTWSCQIFLNDYKLNESSFSGKLHFCLYDHFGLDAKDLYVNGVGDMSGFRSWYILQHYKEIKGCYTPFVTVIEFDVPFFGELE